MKRPIGNDRERITASIGSGRRRIRAVGVVLTLLALLPGATAVGFVPRPDRTIKAIAEVNRVSGRTNAIQLDLKMRIGDREPLAVGELISHPTGLARLELRGFGGRVDRYLLSGDELLAAKDGQPLDRPQPMLQPIFLLQPATEATLRAALATFGVRSEWIGLAPCGEEDCFVIGDPRVDVPLPPGQRSGTVVAAEARRESGAARGREPLSGGLDGPLSGPSLALPEEGRIPRFWVDVEDLQVRRIDRRDGVFVIFGPTVNFEKLAVPAWFEIHEPGAQPIRFDVERALQVNAAPKAFSRSWLFTPVNPDPAASTKGAQSPPPASLSGD